MDLETWILKHETWILKHETWILKHGTKTPTNLPVPSLKSYFSGFCLIWVAAGFGGCASEKNPQPLLVGASEVKITPELGETYLDYNGNFRWDDDEPFDDKNKNGTFDPLWLANDVRRAALQINDDLAWTPSGTAFLNSNAFASILTIPGWVWISW